ncbi:MAG: hypothetical protein RMX96_14110 [Nostoc sp. ChiSLP02]|nr:hypothetical protein [Nostoc sp. DedSLP05]MDZ8099771.1 hypothetical protein [Nostoc sp. DedSLP01]MDZ8185972.1 hypothetical protein [Nostoc sp. ChiSLP02]
MEGSSSQLDSSDPTYREAVRAVNPIAHAFPHHLGLCVPGIGEDSQFRQRLLDLLQIKRL